MERQSGAQPHPISKLFPVGMYLSRPRYRWTLLVLCMTLWPWFWVSYGLFGIKDFRATMLLYEILCCGVPAWFLWREKTSILPLKLPISVLLLTCLITNVLCLGLFKQTDGMIIDWRVFGPHLRAIGLQADASFWLYGLYFVLFNPVFEEIFWRGVVYREWRTRLSPWRANLLSSFFFGAWHWIILQYYFEPFWAVFSAVIVMLGGVMFAYSYEKSGTLGAPILLHGLGADLPLVFLLYTAMIHSAG